MATGAEITRLISNAQMRLPGATLAVIQYELFEVMDDFFKNTNVWTEDIPIVLSGADPAGTQYPLAPQEPSLVDKLLWVFTQPTSGSTLVRGEQVGAGMNTPGYMTLTSQPMTAVTLIATVALTVQDPVDRNGYVSFPLWVIQKYHNVILDGLLARLMSQPNKPYTNTQMTVFHTRRFDIGKAKARVEATRNYTYRQQAWRFPGFVGGTQKGRSSNWAPPQ